jgi:putative FmdB family regulatory protein
LPIYEYRCTNGHVFEVIASMTDEPVTTCQVCGAPVERVFHPVAVHFKGSGFYTTDYGRGRGSNAATSSDSTDSGSKSDSGSSDTGAGSTKTDSKESVTKKSDSSKTSDSSD